MDGYIQTKQDYIYLLGGMHECSVDTINKTLMDVKNLEQFMGIQPQLKQCLLQQLSKQVILNVSSMYYLQQLKQYYATYTPQTFNIFNYIKIFYRINKNSSDFTNNTKNTNRIYR